jgi:hypothetical protein
MKSLVASPKRRRLEQADAYTRHRCGRMVERHDLVAIRKSGCHQHAAEPRSLTPSLDTGSPVVSSVPLRTTTEHTAAR